MKIEKKLCVIVVFALLTVGCSTKTDKTEPLVRKVKVDKVEKASSTVQKQFSGLVKEAKAVNLSFRVAGPIKKLYVKQGSFIKQGALVGEIDTRDYELQLSVAQAEFEKVTTETKRVAELYKRNGVTDNDYEKAVAGEKMITAQLNRAKDQLNDTKLYAPFSGYIQTLNFESGEIVNIGMPVAELIDLNSLQVVVDIPASLFMLKDQFNKYTCCQHSDTASELPLELINYQAKANSSRLFRLFFQLDPDSKPTLAPGMEVLVNISYDLVSTNLLVVPLDAVFNRNGQSYVWVYNQTDSTVTKQAVELDNMHGNGKVMLKSGLTGNETIVVGGVNVLNDNEKIEIIKPVSKTNIGGLL